MSDTPQERDSLPVGAEQQDTEQQDTEQQDEGRAPGSGRSRGAQGSGRAGKLSARAQATERAIATRRIGIRELRQHASVFVDLAEKGYTVDITNRGRLVAQLVPAREPGSAMERLIAAGIVEPAEESGGVGGLDPYPPPPAGQPTAGDVIDSDRTRRAGRQDGRDAR